tara:strand:+ start:1236 stop:1499 length:264 start_codon:yes stop_codon:yes gene_type:complete
MSANSHNGFSFGPFASASAGVNELANNLYFAYLFDQSHKYYMELQSEYEKALLLGEEEKISRAAYEIQLYEGVFNLSLSYNSDELES